MAKGKVVGSKAVCVRGSGKTYEECCGSADFEPVNLPWAFGGTSINAQQIYAALKTAGVKRCAAASVVGHLRVPAGDHREKIVGIAAESASNLASHQRLSV